MAEEPLFTLPGRIQPQWTQRRASQVRAAIQKRLRRRRVLRLAVGTSSLVLAAVFALRLARKPPEEMATRRAAPPAPPVARATEPIATPLTSDTELVVDPEGAGRAFLLRRGSARFVVSHDGQHPFRVRVGQLLVEDLGTVFTVARLSEYRFEVGVEEGHVAVLCAASRTELGAGARRGFTCGEPENLAVAEPIPPAATHAPKVAPRRASGAVEPPNPVVQAPPKTTPSWQLLAERGHYHEAYESLHRGSETTVRDETHELLLAADTARLSGHAGEAVPYLRRILAQHADDPRGDLAAFTLGRVLLDELGRPAEAAQAFERARSPSAALAEDALAREIEAWARAGDARRAHALALEYQHRYPNGRRMRAVARFGGLEP